jgi:hypothetical protein
LYWLICKRKKCVAYPQEDFLFYKIITSLRISLLNNCKKDFQFHTESKFFYMTYLNFTFLGSHDSRLHFRPHKVYFFELSIKFYIKSSPKWKRSQKFVWKLPDRICSRSPKINKIDWGPNQSLIQKDKSLSWTERVEVDSQTFRGRRQTAGDGILSFVQIGFSSIKSHNSSRKSIKKFFWKLRNQYFILTSFIESKKEYFKDSKTYNFHKIQFFI